MTVKILFMTLAFVLAIPAMALRSGDKALEPLQVKWYKGSAFRFAYPNTNENSKKLSVAVFLLCRAPQAVPSMMMLESLAAKYGKNINIAVITPDSADDLKMLLNILPINRISAGVDESRKLTAEFMAGSPLYPMAFVTDYKGKIIWSGEAVDLGEMVSRRFEGQFDEKAAKEISPLLDELHVCMRNNDDRRMSNIVEKILALEPGNAAALRLRLFSLEQRNRTLEAWQLLYSELEKAPAIARLYFTGIDLITADRRIAGQLEKLLVSFERNIRDAEHRSLMAYTLCERISYNSVALQMADKLLATVKVEELSGASAALYYAAKADVSYRKCQLENAVQFQEKCVECWQSAGSEININNAKARLDYFTSIGK